MLTITNKKIFCTVVLCLCFISAMALPNSKGKSSVSTQSVEIFTTLPSAIPYRIPAIAQTKKANLVAISDYRFCGGDIGNGRVDLHERISTDGGKTWGKETTIARGSGSWGVWHCGFGDAAIVCDHHDGTLLLVCVCGSTVYGARTTNRENPNRVARMYSHNGGLSWTFPEDITDSIYPLFDKGAPGPIASLFVGSGRIFQSTIIKHGTHYRIYAALCARPGGNRVIYSDDFGKNWQCLGTSDDTPVPQGDEPKITELPDGTVLISSRMYGGRWFNIFHYTDKKHTIGKWGTAAQSNADNQGVTAKSNACNGGILIVPARRKADGKSGFVMLQSVPLGPGRANVGIYYKGMFEPSQWSSADKIAANWDGCIQCSELNSAYSELLLLQNKRIAIVYEESTHQADYSIHYKDFSLQEITDGKYQ